MNPIHLSQEDATKLLIEWLRDPQYQNCPQYGYDIYLPSLIRIYLTKNQIHPPEDHGELVKLSPLFYAAAWELCRRGIIRPGVVMYSAQSTPEGSAGDGYSITPFGKKWLQEKSHSDFIPTEPERFAQMLEPYAGKFGASFHQRAQEAIRCYGAHAYLACCAMCGAAAESILLVTAVSKTNDEIAVLKKYFSQGGRQKVENILTGQADRQLKEEFQTYHSLIKYWRDEAAHGQISKIDENEAYTALAILLRFAIFVNKRWESIINNCLS